MKFKSVLDNVVYLDIETTGLNPANAEIIEIGALKIKDSIQSELSILLKPRKQVPISIYHLCSGLKEEDLENGHTLEEAKKMLLEFVDDLPIICHNASFEISFFDTYIPEMKNVFLDSMELAAILEPSRKSFNLQDLLNEITTISKREEHRGLNDSIDTMIVVNSLLCRLWQKEEELNRVDKLYNDITKLFNGKEEWIWKRYLLRPIIFSFTDCPYVLFKEMKSKTYRSYQKQINYLEYEKLLRNEEIWNSGGDFKYQYRADQEKISAKIRENYSKNRRIFIEAPTGSGKTFAYLLIASIVTYLNKQNKRYDDSSFIISTDTKELQNQLIDKDIPNILKKLNLLNKVKFGAMKGKGNYICMNRLIKSKDFEDDSESILALLFLKRYGEDGTSGDLENINFWAQNHFKLEKFKQHINCDSEECNLDRCKTTCYLKNRYNELPQENITVINHSLLASWPYSEKRKINHLVIDEAHNLMEKSYDFFSEEFNTYEFMELLKQVDNHNPSIIFLLRRLNGLYNYKEHIDIDNIKTKTKDIEISIAHMLNEISRLGLTNGKYNYTDEFFNGEVRLKEVSKEISELLSEIKRCIYNLYRVLDNYLRNIVDEDEKETGNEYRTLINFAGKLKGAFDIIDNFLEVSRDYAKIFEVSKDFTYFVVKNTPLNIASLINENILNEVKSTVFISATLRINNSFNNIKTLLGQKEADVFYINPVFNLKDRTKIFTVKDIGYYTEEEKYSENTAKFIYQVAIKLKWHVLILFSNNLRRQNVQEKLEHLIKGTAIEVFTNKKAIQFLKDKDRQVIILGSKGFFEGIDLPGDSLNCVMIDKIPNVNPTEPLYKALKAYRKVYYGGYNYPKVCIRMKQGYGRLIRSIYDYGYFIILDGGTNKDTLRILERDLNGPKIEARFSKEILNTIKFDYSKWKRENLVNIINDLSGLDSELYFNENFKKSNLFFEYNGIDKGKNSLIFKSLDELFSIVKIDK